MIQRLIIAASCVVLGLLSGPVVCFAGNDKAEKPAAKKVEQPVNAQKPKMGEIGWKQGPWSDPAREFVVVGVFTNSPADEMFFVPDKEQPIEKGKTFDDIPLNYFVKFLNQQKNAGAKLPSYDAKDYVNKRAKLTFIASANHPGKDAKYHVFQQAFFKGIEIVKTKPLKPVPATPDEPKQEAAEAGDTPSPETPVR